MCQPQADRRALGLNRQARVWRELSLERPAYWFVGLGLLREDQHAAAIAMAAPTIGTPTTNANTQIRAAIS